MSLAAWIVCLAIAMNSGFRSFGFTAFASTAGLIFSLRYPKRILQFLIFMVPLTGLLNLLADVRGVPVMLAVLYAGVAGENLSRRNEEGFFYPLATRTFVGVALFSVFVAGIKSFGYKAFPLSNALGWIALDFCYVLSGPVVYRLFKEHGVCPRDFFWAFSVPIFIGMAQYFGLTSFATVSAFILSGRPQYNGFFSDSNAQAMVCALLLPLFFSFLFALARVRQVCLWGGVLMFLLFISGSRSAFIAAAVGGVVFFTYAALKRPRLAAAMAALVVVFGLAIGATTYWFAASGRHLRTHYLLMDVSSVLSGELSVSTLVGNRRDMWRGAFALIGNAPVIGCGLGRYMIELPRHREKIQQIVNDNAGNQYLQVAAEQGMIGLLAFLFLLGSFGVEFLQCARKTAVQWGAFAGFCGLLVSFMFGSHIKNFEVNFFFWGILALMAAPAGKDQYEHSQ